MALVARFVLFGVFRFRVDVQGRELLPRTGGYIVVAAAHRGWMDPFVVLVALPLEPRVWFLGSGPSAFGPRWREALIHRLGGLLPVWRGGVGVDKHVAAAQAVVANGAVFAQMPEGTVSGPVGRIGPFRSGAALIALRTGAPIVLLAMAGTEELYLGRRMAARILPPTSVAELLGPDWDGRLPGGGLAPGARPRPAPDRPVRGASRAGRRRPLSLDHRPDRSSPAVPPAADLAAPAQRPARPRDAQPASDG